MKNIKKYWWVILILIIIAALLAGSSILNHYYYEKYGVGFVEHLLDSVMTDRHMVFYDD